MDPTAPKPAGWYPSSRTPGMERYWNGDFWTGDYRPAVELQGQFGIAAHEEALPEAPVNEPAPDVWSHLEQAAPGSNETFIAPEVRTEYAASAPYSSAPPPQPKMASYPYVPDAPAPQQNTLGIVAFVMVFFAPPVGAILGHVSYSKAKREGIPKGLSLAAIITGWLFFALSMLFWIPFMVFFANADSTSYSSGYDYTDESAVPSYVLDTNVSENLEKSYPDYDWWYVGCDDSLPLEAGATVTCEAVVYPFAEGNASEDHVATVEYLGGKYYNPELRVTLDREPRPLSEWPQQ